MGILFGNEPEEVYEMKQRLGIIHLSDMFLDMWRKVETTEEADSIARSLDLFGGFESNHGTVRISDENVRSFRLKLSDGLEVDTSTFISYEASMTGRFPRVLLCHLVDSGKHLFTWIKTWGSKSVHFSVSKVLAEVEEHKDFAHSGMEEEDRRSL